MINKIKMMRRIVPMVLLFASYACQDSFEFMIDALGKRVAHRFVGSWPYVWLAGHDGSTDRDDSAYWKSCCLRALVRPAQS